MILVLPIHTVTIETKNSVNILAQRCNLYNVKARPHYIIIEMFMLLTKSLGFKQFKAFIETRPHYVLC